MNQFLASRNIPRHIQANWFALFVKAIFVIALRVGSMWLAASSGCWAADHSMCLIMRRTPNSAPVDRVDFATPLSLPSRSVTGLSALAPAQRAGAQRLCALALPGSVRDRRRLPVMRVQRKTFAHIEFFASCEGFPTPAPEPAAHSVIGPASENLHISRLDFAPPNLAQRKSACLTQDIDAQNTVNPRF